MKQQHHRALRWLGDQLNATKKMWDLNAARAILAYKWGRPVERQITAHADAKDFPELLRRLQHSEAYLAAEAELDTSLEKTVQGKEIPPALPADDR